MFSAVLLVAAVIGGSVPAYAAPVMTGSISGRVVDGTGTPISGICVKVEKGTEVQSDEAGTYVIPDLEAGDYKAVFTDCNAPSRFVEQWYVGHLNADGADFVSVTDDTVTSLPDVTMVAGVVVSGTVTDVNSVPISDITVDIKPIGSVLITVSARSGADGSYTTVPMAPGDYKVQFTDSNPVPQWSPQYWKQAASWDSADTLKLVPADGDEHGGVDARLTTGATIEGTVRGPDHGPLEGMCVDANLTSDNGGTNWIAGSTTGSDGTYSIEHLPATDIRVHFRECNSGPYLDQWYNASADASSSTPVVLSAGEVRPRIDAELEMGISVSGRVRDANGDPIAGIGVNVNPTDSGGSGWGQTDSAGRFTTSGLAPGTYRVQFRDFSPEPEWASQYWRGKLSYSSAEILTLSGGDGPVRGGVNATLSRAAAVSGRVTRSGGAPVDQICVSAEVPFGEGTDWVGGATTAADGTYRITGLPATETVVRFQDCNNVGPYLQQWWEQQADGSTATPIVLEPGATRSGINAVMAAAAQIKGSVTDSAGHPLQGICAQATTATFVGGIAGTNEHGEYAIDLSQSGDYKVQFVDCRGTPRFAGEWWDNQKSRADGRVVSVATGQIVDGVDAVLALGATGSISGKLVNFHGAAMTTACVIAFVPDKFALVGQVNPDGTFTIPDVPSGTYALVFLGCDGGEPSGVVRDPQSAATSYRGVWWKGAVVDLADHGAPDPIRDGATLVAVRPGQDLTGFDWCFGCTAIEITSVTPTDGSLTVAFTTPGLLPAGIQSLAVAPAATGFSYTVTCTSPTGVTGVATGTSSPITVSGLTVGASYTCTVVASNGGVTVASSPVSEVVVSAENGTIPVVVPASLPTAASTPSAGSDLARTGADSMMQARLGLVLLALGGALVFAGRKRRRALVSRR